MNDFTARILNYREVLEHYHRNNFVLPRLVRSQFDIDRFIELCPKNISDDEEWYHFKQSTALITEAANEIFEEYYIDFTFHSDICVRAFVDWGMYIERYNDTEICVEVDTENGYTIPPLIGKFADIKEELAKRYKILEMREILTK